MAEKNAPLPKFGDWDEKNPAASNDFSVIFDKARNAKRDGARPPSRTTTTRRDQLDSPTRKDRPNNNSSPSSNTPAAHFLYLGKSRTGRKWLCCVGRRTHTD